MPRIGTNEKFYIVMYTFTAICRRIKIWWNTPCYYSIVNGMPPVYESEEELHRTAGTGTCSMEMTGCVMPFSLMVCFIMTVVLKTLERL